MSRLFANSEGAFCGASFPSVGVGDHSYPIFSDVTTAGDFARDGAESTPGGSITINTATNRRLQGTMDLASEDENRIPNITGSLTSHLRAKVTEVLDEYAIAQLRDGLAITPNASTTIETLSAFLSRWGAVVDGKAARNVGEIRALIGSGTTSVFSLLSGLSLGSGGSHFWEMPRLTDPNYLRGSAHIPAVASQNQEVIFTKIGAGINLRRLIVPIWRRGQLLRDTGGGQLAGRIRYTVAMFAAVELTATDQHRRGSVHLS